MAIVTKENQRLYLRTWEYNAARIITELANIVENHGGRVKPMEYNAVISNRHLSESIKEAQSKIDSVKTAIKERGTTEAREKYLSDNEKELAQMEAIDNEPITVAHTSYITFIDDEKRYYYQVNSNPFFEFYYSKTPIKNGKYSRDAALMEDKKDWLYDCFFGFSASKADVTEAANLIYNMLINAPNSPIMRDGKKQRVPNTYNDGYHLEMVYAPERIGKIDF